MELKSYVSHKVVKAGKIVSVLVANNGLVVVNKIGENETIDVPENFFVRGYPSEGDYYVEYEDGYASWSPETAFENGYTEQEAEPVEVKQPTA